MESTGAGTALFHVQGWFPMSATRKNLLSWSRPVRLTAEQFRPWFCSHSLPHDKTPRQLQARKYQIRIRESCAACCVDHSVLGSPHARIAEPARGLRTRLCTYQIAFSGPISTIAVLESSFWRRRKAFAGARVQEIERREWEMWAPSRFLPWTLLLLGAAPYTSTWWVRFACLPEVQVAAKWRDPLSPKSGVFCERWRPLHHPKFSRCCT